jgi:hypothetical protein
MMHQLILMEKTLKNFKCIHSTTPMPKRFKAIQSLIKQGDKRAIDSVEAGISLKSRQLSLENSFEITKIKTRIIFFMAR